MSQGARTRARLKARMPITLSGPYESDADRADRWDGIVGLACAAIFAGLLACLIFNVI